MSKSSTLGRSLRSPNGPKSAAAASTSTSTNGNNPTTIIALLSIDDASTHVRSAVSLSTPLFTPSPSIVRFSNYRPFLPLTAQLTLTNQDHVSRRIKIEQPKDHHFKIIATTRPGLSATQAMARSTKVSEEEKSSSSLLTHSNRSNEDQLADEMGSSKIAPGMAIQYTIQFTPRDRADYSCDLVCTTEREQFLIPIRAEGDRPAIEMPDSLEFGVAPVCHPTIKPILIRNSGPIPAQFSFSVMAASPNARLEEDQPPPFTVEPAHGVLQVDETIQVLVSFVPNVIGPVAYKLVADISADGVSGSSLPNSDGSAANFSSTAGGSTFASLSTHITPVVASTLGVTTGLFSSTGAVSSSVSASTVVNVLSSMVLTGCGADVEVELESTNIKADPTYVGLKSQKTVLLHNHSNIPITFTVRNLASKSLDQQDRARRIAELHRLEAQDRLHLDEIVDRMKEDEAESKLAREYVRKQERYLARHEARRAEAESRGFEFDSSDEEQDRAGEDEDAPTDEVLDATPEELVQLDLLRAEQYIVRKYQRLHRQLDADSMTHYRNPHYSFDPIEGEIWPKGTKELTITFSPDAAGVFPSTAYLEVSGRLDRIPVQLSGHGLGSEARFSYATMDIGTVYMNAPHRYEVTLQNIGNIPSSWRISHGSCLGGMAPHNTSRFRFSPSEGTLQVTPGGGVGALEEDLTSRASSDAADRVTIQVDFLSAIIGEFQETIFFELIGNSEPLKLTYKGKVIGPTFFFEESRIDYGVVSYGFLNSRILHLHNTSAIEMKAKFHIDQDGQFMNREFGLIMVSNKLEDEHGNVIEDESPLSPKQIDDEDGWSFDPRPEDPVNLTTTAGNVATIPPYHHAQIQVDLISESADKKYDDPSNPYSLHVDVEGVGENIVTLPIKATCVVPVPTVDKNMLNYETVFLRHTYTQLLPLRNDTDLFAKFEVVPQDEHSKSVVIVEPEVYSANIAPHSTYQLKMLVTSHRLGRFSQPFYIQIPGSNKIPFVCHAEGGCRGPRVTLDSKSVNFGSIPALTSSVKTLTLQNDSPISARFKAFIHKKGSCYTVDCSRGTIGPFGRFVLHITAYLNETLPMPDMLHVQIEEGDDINIPLRAQGTGTTVATTLIEGENRVDHGDQLTNTLITREFRLENRGRRTQILQWEFVPDLGPSHQRTATLQSASSTSTDSKSPERTLNPLDILSRVARMKKLGNDAELAALPQAIFSITPSKITLEPNTAMVFTLSGESAKAGSVSERWVCKSLVGQAKKLEVIYDTLITANFITPMLAFNVQSMSFTQVVDPKTTLVLPEPQILTLTNRTALPLKFRLKVPYPFTAAASEFLLEAGQTSETAISFAPDISDPSPYKRTSTKMKQELVVVYADHPQRDRIMLHGDLCYPNLTFSMSKVDFGSILNETSKRMLLTITNHSTIESTYRWLFSDKVFGKSELTSRSSSRRATPPPSSGRRGTPNPTLKMGTDASSIPMNELFDILPIRGSLKPGESEQVELTFYGHQEAKVECLALCDVDGGPEYEVKLKGEASAVSYSLDCTIIQFGPHDINFGPQDLFATTWKEVTLSNDGRVAFEYKTLPQDERVLPLIECVPSVGRLKAGEKVKLQVRFITAKPDTLEGELFLQVGCFDPVAIALSAVGVLPLLAVDLPTASEWLAESASPDAQLMESAEFSVARYVADLGPIIKNTVHDISFTIRNVGPVFASYTIDKKSFNSSIFSIEPTMVTRVPPGQSTTFTIVCRASNPTKNKIQKKDIFDGREFMHVGVPILVRNGPPMLLHICAHVTVPDVLLSQTKLDFGKVVLNQRREITVQLHNNKAVPASWAFSNPIGSNVRDKDCFELVPSSGTLMPGEKVNVCIAYTPSLLEERKSLVRIPLKIDRNPKLVHLMATGTGVGTHITFEPTTLRLPNTLPYAPTEPTPFQVVNHTDRPIEVYSVDFDRVYFMEEDILHGDDGFDDPKHPGIMYIPPRLPGESLPNEIIQRYKLRAKKQKRVDDDKAGRPDQVGSLVDAALVSEATGIGSPLHAHGAESSLDSLNPLTSELVRNVLLIGAPFGGKSTLARGLVTSLELRPHQLFNIDHAVRYFFELNEKEAEETEVLSIREKEYTREYEKCSKKLSKSSRGGPTLSAAELHQAIIAEIGVVDTRSQLQVTPEERALATTVFNAITAARARIAFEAQEAMIAAKLLAKSAGKGQPAAAAGGSATPSKPGTASGKAPQAAVDGGRTSPSPRNSSVVQPPSARRGKNAPAPAGGLFEPDQDMQEYLHAHTFFDLRGVKDVLSEAVLSEVLLRYLLIQSGRTFKEGCIIDGLDSCFAQPVDIARVIRAAFAQLPAATPPRENNLHIITLDLTRDAALQRLQSARAQAKSLLDDEQLAATLKRFKILSGREIDKMTDAKRQEYERTLDSYTRRRESEVALFQMDHIDPQRFDAYWNAQPTHATETTSPRSQPNPAGDQPHSTRRRSSTSSSLVFPPPSLDSSTPVFDPLVAILSAFDLPSFTPATDMPEVILPEEQPLTPEEIDAQQEAERIAAEQLANEEAAAAAAAEADAAAAKASRRSTKKGSSASGSPAASPTRHSSADGRKATASGAAPLIEPLPLQVPTHLQPSKWDSIPVKTSAMSGLPSIKYIKVRRFESAVNFHRILNSVQGWIDELFRIEIDPRTLDPNWIPPPVTWQMLRRTGVSAHRGRSTDGFVLVDPVLEEEARLARVAAEEAAIKKAQEEAAAAAEEEARKKHKGSASKARKPPAEPAVDTAPVAEPLPLPPSRKVATRWTIPANSSVTLYASFTSNHVGSFSSILGFEVVGLEGRTLTLPLNSICAVPEIASDPRSIFMKKPKVSKPGMTIIQKTFITNEKVFEFGPIMVGKDPDTRHAHQNTPLPAPSNGLINNDPNQPIEINGLTLQPMPSKKTNADVWRISNSGPFATHIDLSFLTGVDSSQAAAATAPSTASDSKKTGRASGKKDDRSPSPGPKSDESKSLTASKKGGKKGGLSDKDLKALEKQREMDRIAEDARWDVLRSKRVFIVEPCAFDLAVDESRDITVWAFPQATATFCDTLVATIKDNPTPVQLPVRVTGAKPSLNLSTCDVTFDRLLLAQEETRTVDIVNTGTLPVAWSISGLDQLPGEEILSIGPVTRGILQPNSPPFTLSIHFRAKEEKAFNIPLFVDARDVEGFLGVLDSIPLTVKCESYQNKAHLDFGVVGVPGAAATQPATEVTFELLRVGDQAEQTFAIVNEGLYEVRYKLVVPPPTSRYAPIAGSKSDLFDKMFLLSVSEGVLPSHHRQDVIVQLRPDRAFNWVRDPCLKLYLYESGSDTPTKKFDVPITAAATYSHYHILPNSAVNFGPVETGAQVSKTITLHNDGAFDFEYRFYPKAASHVYSRVSVLARSDERDRLESEGGKASKGSSSSTKKKDSAPVWKLGSRPKVAPPMVRPVGPQPTQINTTGKPTKEDKKKSSTTPRSGEGKNSTPMQSSRAIGNAPGTDRKISTSAGVNGMATPKGPPGKKPKQGEFVIYDQPFELEVGPFLLHDPCGFVRAGQSVEIQVDMSSEAPHTPFDEAIELEITNLDSTASLIPYGLLSESCTPGLDTVGFRRIFEEQDVRPDLIRKPDVTAEQVPKDFFAAKERVFQFAPVLVNTPPTHTMSPSPSTGSLTSPSHGRPQSPHSKPPSPRAGSARSISSPSHAESRNGRRGKQQPATVEVTPDPSLPPVVGKTVRWRIENPFKITANVTLHMHAQPPPPATIISPSAAREQKDGKKSSKGGAASSAASASASTGSVAGTPSQPKKSLSSKERAAAEALMPPPSAFTLSDSSLVIPPGEHRYVSLTFKPDSARTFTGWFEALVEAGLDAHTRSLCFEVRGDGALPCITPVQPTARDEDGRPLIDFHRLFHTGGATLSSPASATRLVAVKNDGVVPATARFDLLVKSPSMSTFQVIPSTQSTFFGFSGRGKLVTLLPGETATFDAAFVPNGVGLYQAELRMSIVSNPYGTISFNMRGESFLQDVTIEAANMETIPLLTANAPDDNANNAAANTASRKNLSTPGKDSSSNGSLASASPPLVHHLPFPDSGLSQSVSQVVTLINHSESTYKFAWMPPPTSLGQPGGASLGDATKRGSSKKDASGGSSGSGSSKKKAELAEEAARRAEEEAKRRSADGSAAAASALAAALAAAGSDGCDPALPDFTFSPSIGHLPPHSTKNITVTFRSNLLRQYTHALSSCVLQRIRYVNPDGAKSPGGDKKSNSRQLKKDAAAAARGSSAGASRGEDEKTLLSSSSSGTLDIEAYVPSNTEWDNSQTIIRWITESEAKERADQAAAQANNAKEKKPKKSSINGGSGPKSSRSVADDSASTAAALVQISEVAPEPLFELVDPPVAEPKSSKAAGSDSARSQTRTLQLSNSSSHLSGSTVTSHLDLRLSAASDVSRYELALPSQVVHFRPTFMYQTRVFTFTIANPASTKLAYEWRIDPIRFEADEDKEEPFTITPQVGVVQPKQNQTFTLKFSPLAARDYRTTMRALIPDLTVNQSAPVLDLRGSSLRPKCHFELAPSDYLTASPARRPQQFTTVVDPATRVIEFKSMGVRVKNLRKFYVVNPTDVSYAFQWKNEDAEVNAAASAAAAAAAAASASSQPSSAPLSPVGSSMDLLLPAAVSSSLPPLLTPRGSSAALHLKSPFKCLTPRGVIESGRKFEMIFEYTPQVEAQAESHWRFIIPNDKEEESKEATITPPSSLSVPFLLSGLVSQPWLELDRTFLHFPALIVGQKKTETIYLTNVENATFSWSVEKASCPQEILAISPSSGTITANSKFAIELTFRPNEETNYNFNVNFIVKSKPSKLSVNIKGTGYALRTELTLVSGDLHAESARRQLARIESDQRAAAEAAAAIAAAESQTSKSARGSAGKSRKEKANAAAAHAAALAAHSLAVPAGSPSVPSISLPALVGSSGPPSASAAAAAAHMQAGSTPTPDLQSQSQSHVQPQRPPSPPPAIPTGGLADISVMGFDLANGDAINELTSPTSAIATRIDFGTFPVHTRQVKHLLLHNSSQFHVDFKCHLPSNPLVKLSPMSGQIHSGHTMVVDLLAAARDEQDVHSLRASIAIGGVKKYALAISGSTTKPNRFTQMLYK